MAFDKLITHVNGNPIAGAVYYVVGTQATDTGSWTGVLPISALYDGLTIVYYLPTNGSGDATLNLTLSGGTTTGAKPVYLNTYSRISTQFVKGSSITLVYRDSRVNSAGTTISQSWVHVADHDTTNNYELRMSNSPIKAASAITAGTIIVGTANGYKTAGSGVTFDLQYPILHARDSIANGATGAYNFIARPEVDFTKNKNGWSGTSYSVVFLVATLSGSTATIDSAVFTTTAPSSADGKIYIPVGILRGSTNVGYFYPTGQIFSYVNGRFGPLEPDTSGLVSKVASTTDNALVRFDGTGGALQNSTATLDDNGQLSVDRVILSANSEAYTNAPLRLGNSRIGQIAGTGVLNITGKNGIFLGTSYTTLSSGYNVTSTYITGAGNATIGKDNGNGTYSQFAGMYSQKFYENGSELSTVYAKLASPDFTGTPTAPTAAAGTSTTQIATTAFVANAVSGASGNYAPAAANGYVPFDNANKDVSTIRNLTITGDLTTTRNLTVTGNLTVQGTTTTVDSTSLEVSDALITLAKGNTVTLTQFAGFVVPKYDGTHNGALVFDNTGTAYVGDATLTNSGTIEAQGDMKPLTTRTGSFTDGHIIVWDSDATSIKDGGALSVGVTSVTAGAGLNTTSNDTVTDGGSITSTGTIYLTKSGATAGSYGPSGDTQPSHGGTFSVPYLTVDKYGRVTAASTKTITLPTDSNTDTKVTQDYSTANAAYPILMSASAGVTATTSRGATTSVLNNQLYANPNTGSLYAKKLYENGEEISSKYYLASNPSGYTSNTGTVIGSGLTSGYFVVGNNGVNVQISSMKPTASTTTWSASSDVNVPTMKAISDYITSLDLASDTTSIDASAWTAGTTAGPTLSLKHGNTVIHTTDAIPGASGGQSGVVTTGGQVFGGIKGFNAKYLYIFGGTSASDPSFLRVEYRTGTASTSYGALMSVGGNTLKLGINNASAVNSGNYTWNAPTKFLSVDTSGNVTADGYIKGNSIKTTNGTNDQILLAGGGIMNKADLLEYIDLTS